MSLNIDLKGAVRKWNNNVLKLGLKKGSEKSISQNNLHTQTSHRINLAWSSFTYIYARIVAEILPNQIVFYIYRFSFGVGSTRIEGQLILVWTSLCHKREGFSDRIINFVIKAHFIRGFTIQT